MMVLGNGGSLGGDYITNENSALTKETPESSTAPSIMWSYSEKMSFYEEAGFRQTQNLLMPWS